MSLRSRAFLTGMATGFLRSNNERRAKMADRMQQLSDNSSEMARERAKSRAAAGMKGAQEEESDIKALRAAGHLEQDSLEYTTAYWNDKTRDIWKESQFKTQEEFIEQYYKQNRPKAYKREFKDTSEIQRNLSDIEKAIQMRQSNEVSRTVSTPLDRLLSFGTLKEEGGSNVRIPELDVKAAQGPVDTFESTGGTLEKPKELKPKFTNISDSGESMWIGNKRVDDTVSATYKDEYGTEYIAHGVMKGDEFVHIPELTDTKGSPEGKVQPYEGDTNIKISEEAHAILYSTTRALKTIDNIERHYQPQAYGSDALFTDVGNFLHASLRVFDPSYKGSAGEKVEVLDVMRYKSQEVQLPLEMQKALDEGNEEALYEMAKQYYAEGYTQDLQAFTATALTSEQQQIAARLSRATVSAELQPLVRDLLRAWTGGEKKVAWGAAEKLLESLEPDSTPEKLIAQLDTYKRDMTTLSFEQLENKWQASRYSFNNDTERGFLKKDIKDYGETEYYKNPKTGEILMVQTGTDINDKGYRYFIPSGQRSVFELPLPSPGLAPTAKEERMFKHTQRMLKEYTQELNIHGNIIK